MKVQRYFCFIRMVLICFAIVFSFICQPVFSSQAETFSCKTSISYLKGIVHLAMSKFDFSLQKKTLGKDQLRKEYERLNRDLEKIEEDQEEFQLQTRRFKSSYYSGVDQAKKFARIGEYMRNIKASANTTHIPYFANQIEVHIKEIERGIKSQTENIEERLKILEDFKKEAQSRIDSQTVTYFWWVMFNIRLSVLVVSPAVLRRIIQSNLDNPRVREYLGWNKGPVEEIDYLNLHGIIQELFKNEKYKYLFYGTLDMNHIIGLVNRFPEDVMFFVTKKLGLMAFNRMGERDYLMELSGDEKIFLDDELHNSLSLIGHDLDHTGPIFRVSNKFIRQVEKRIDRISDVKEREKVELVWFIFRHEDGNPFPHTVKIMRIFRRSYRGHIRQMMIADRRRFMSAKDLQEALPDDVDFNNPEQVEKFLEESADAFSNMLFSIKRYSIWFAP